MGWLRLVGSLKVQVSFAEYSLFYRALVQKRPIILRSLLIVATPYALYAFSLPLLYSLRYADVRHSLMLRFTRTMMHVTRLDANVNIYTRFDVRHPLLIWTCASTAMKHTVM